jgi:hypothetical protein
MELEGHGTGSFLSGGAEIKDTGNHNHAQNHEQCQSKADRLFHDVPPIKIISYVLKYTYFVSINWKRLKCKIIFV